MPAPPAAAGPALGIDFGERRIGVALSDPERRLAVPWGVVERRSDRQAIGELAALARREGATFLVAGEPRGLDGAAGEAARRARGFAERLARAARLPLVLVDEALTSDEAARRLAAAGLDRRARSGRIDAVAAQILLQEALDRGLAPMSEASPAGGPPEAPAGDPEAGASPDRSEKR
ncbi:MAG TPA: Holliday junction resolvase RuvX [Thermoanaerobaculia bacterium]